MDLSPYIIDGVRSPIGSFGGSLRDVRADDLAAHAISSLMERHPNMDPAAVADVLLGCANQAGEDNRNVARMASLLAGLPTSVPGETINRLCASGLSAIHQAARAMTHGDGHVFIAGGVEHMTRAPYVISKSGRPYGTDSQFYDSSFGWRFVNPAMRESYGVDAMGETAENLVDQYRISREDQDAFALWSQQKTSAALAAGHFDSDIVPVPIPQRKGARVLVSQDEFPKPQTTLEILSGLRPAFRKNGTVTAGNASGLNDGSAALLMATGEGIRTHNLTPLARVVAGAVAGVEPRTMGIGPVPATQKVLVKAGLRLEDMDVIELNEAFAAQSLACIRALGLADNDPRINPNGGAIALGHPLGMSGARIPLQAARQLQRTQGRYALVTMCIGVGQGFSLILSRY